MSGDGAKAQKVPRHVAIIMDGNGRWARARGLPRLRGHEEGAESVRAVMRACRDAGVHDLTLYAFSVENWVRPRLEIAGLMRLLGRFLDEREHELHENHVRLRVTGRIEDLPGPVRRRLDRVMAATREYDKANLILALSYGGRCELAHAARQIAREAVEGRLNPDRINENTISERLYLPDIPDPDLMIRTSGEMRLSNFLLWQLSYSELYFTDVMWPDFREPQFMEALAEYAHRRRRFGDVKEHDDMDSSRTPGSGRGRRGTPC